ncbi:MAG: hypothetical protein APF84_01070 [Gracilibacter sp. BRH_c7a]|nr:MAG: hypothetical protein APF84_01070 [Gracilibacter sp. BRH_c7a]
MMHGWYGPGWMGQGDYWWMGLVAMLIQILFWGGIIYLVFRLLKNYSRPNFPEKGSDSSLSIIRERYARGEIDLEEYNARKRELEK